MLVIPKISTLSCIYLGEMSLQTMFGLHVLLDTISKCVVDRVPLVDHCRGALVEKSLNLVPHVSGGSALTL